MRTRDFFGYHARWLGKGRMLTLPSKLLRPVFKAVAMGFRVLGSEPPATPDAIGFFSRPNAYSNRKAREMLGYEPRVSFDEGMSRVREWLEREDTL
jgi:nucleoside-diphosphate-sugar epimerase